MPDLGTWARMDVHAARLRLVSGEGGPVGRRRCCALLHLLVPVELPSDRGVGCPVAPCRGCCLPCATVVTDHCAAVLLVCWPAGTAGWTARGPRGSETSAHGTVASLGQNCQRTGGWIRWSELGWADGDGGYHHSTAVQFVLLLNEWTGSSHLSFILSTQEEVILVV